MESVDITRFFFSLAFVIGLIWLTAHLLKRSGLDKRLRGVTSGSGRLQVTEAIYLDPRRKLVLVRADRKEYLLLLNGESTVVVDTLPMKDHA